MMALIPSNPIKEYYGKISSGEIPACKKLITVYRHLTEALERKGTYHYDEKKAQRVIDFIQTFTHPSKGEAAKKPIQLMLWQKAMLSAVFGFVDKDGCRQYQDVYLIVGKKNGKSTLASAVGLYMLTKDGEAGPEVYSAATKRDQARVIWDEACSMIHKSPALRKRCKTLVGGIVCSYNNGIFKPLSKDKNGSLDGLNVSCALLDEIHAWSNMSLFHVIHDGVSTRKQPLSLITSTAGTVRDSVYDDRYELCRKILQGYEDGSYTDERTLPIVYELDNQEEMHDEGAWIKANPSLGVTKKMHYLRRKVNESKSNPVTKKDTLTKEFNIIQTATTSYFELEDLNHATFDIQELKPDYAIGGFDLSRVMDLTAAVALFQVPNDTTIYVESVFFMPEDTLEAHKRDNVPYQIWADNGYLRLCPGNVIDDNMVVEWFRELRDKYDLYLYRVGFDRYSSTHVQQEMAKTFGSGVMVPVAQGTKTLSTPMETSKAWLQQKRINYNDNPIMNWCLMNTEAKMDTNGNVQPFKDRALNKRIDGYAAFLDAFTVYLDTQEEYVNRIS